MVRRLEKQKQWIRKEYPNPNNPKEKIVELRLITGEIVKLRGQTLRVEKYSLEIPLLPFKLVVRKSKKRKKRKSKRCST